MKKTTFLSLFLGCTILMSAKFANSIDFLDSSKESKIASKTLALLVPANDECATAIAVTSFPYSNNQTDGATSTNNGGFITACTGDGMNDGMWYSVVGDGNNITIDVVSDDTFDHQLGVFTGTCGALVCVGTIDDALEGELESYTILNSEVGTVYYINIGDYSSSTDNPEGNFTIEIDSVVPPDAPANDDCANAIEVTAFPYTDSPTDAVAATNNAGSITTCSDSMNDGVWYSLVGDGNSIIINVTPADDFDPQIGVFTGTCGALVCEGTVDDGFFEGEPESYTIQNSVVGTVYYINIASYSDDDDVPEGNFTIDINSVQAPANDTCENAVVLTCGANLTDQTTLGATGGTSTSCIGTIGDDIWYSFAGNGQNITLTATTQDEPVQIEVFESADGTCDGVTLGDCFASGGSGEDETIVSFVAVTGNTYYIHIGNWINGEPGATFDLSVTCEDVPDAVPDCATNVFPADAAVDVAVGDILFTWTAPTTGGPVDSYDFYGGTTTPLTEDDFIANFEDTEADITLTGYSTLFYWKVVPRNLAGEAVGCTEWTFTTVDAPAPPANDACSTATPITSFPFTQNLDATGATNNDGFILCGTSGMNDGIWYTVEGNGFDITVSATSQDWDGELAVFTGSCGAFTCYDIIDDEVSGSPEVIVIEESVVGTTYYINFGHYSGTTNNDEGITDIEVTSDVLGVGENTLSNFKAYPNPVKDVLNLSYAGNITNVTVFNLLGQQVMVKALNADQSQIDMSQLSNGNYLVKITADNNITKTIKVVKQ